MSHFDITSLEKQLADLENETLKEGFWNDSKNSGIILQKIKTIKDNVENYNKLNNELANLTEMSELLIEEAKTSNELDSSLSKDIISNTQSIQNKLEDLEISTLLSGKYDINNAIVTIHPGARRN